MHGETLKN